MLQLFYSIIFIITIQFVAYECDLNVAVNDKYYVSETNATFLHAVVQCKTIGMQLVTINNAVENNNLTNYLYLIGTNSSDTYWIDGLHLNNDAWIWVNSAQLITYTNWGTNEPHFTDTSDHCLVFGKDYGVVDSSKWEAQPCSFARYYICQRNNSTFLNNS